MAAYFFDLLEPDEIRADEAVECGDADQARRRAVEYAREIAADQVRAGELHLDHSIVVRDQHGEVIASVQFRDAVAVAD